MKSIELEQCAKGRTFSVGISESYLTNIRLLMNFIDIILLKAGVVFVANLEFPQRLSGGELEITEVRLKSGIKHGVLQILEL